MYTFRRVCCCITATLLLLPLLLFLSCDKVPMNGDLDGMWQLTSITTPSGLHDATSDRVYVSFQLHLVQWNDIYADRYFYSHFRHTADSIFFYDFAHPSKHAVDDNQDEWVTPAEMDGGLFDIWGIHTTDARYHVLQLDADAMRLQQADTTLTFRKF